MSDKLALLAGLAREQLKAERLVAEAEDLLKQRKSHLRDIAEKQIPEVMDELDLATFETDDGIKVKVLENIRANISKERMEEALKWLRENGYDKIIKHKFEIMPGSEEQAKALEELLTPVNDLDWREQSTVNHMTLSSFVRQLLEDGEDVDLELLGVYRQRVSKIKVGG